MPKALPRIASDVAVSLRSALDQAGYAVAVATGCKRAKPKSGFPFGDTEDQVESRRGGQSRDLPKDIFDVMCGFDPHKGGDGLLWALNAMANAKKHSFVAPCAVASGVGYIEHASISGFISMGPTPWDRTKNEMTLCVIGPGGKADGKLKVSTYIAIYDIEMVEGLPVFDVLFAMRKKVVEVVNAIEAKTVELGIS